ncbi:GMC oxidoreductase [Spirillospora sp. NPDC050679]
MASTESSPAGAGPVGGTAGEGAVGRRRFVGLAGLTGAALAAPAPVGRAGAARTLEEAHRVVIIGSGVGGSVAAFRLAQAGIDNVVLERGRRWPITPAGTTFPRLPVPDPRLFWLDGRPTLPLVSELPHLSRAVDAINSAALPRFTGLLDIVLDDSVTVVCGAGVGGGTLVYGGALPQPHPEPFHRIFPAGIDYGELDRVHYPRARRRMVADRLPLDLLAHPRYRSTRLWSQALARTGLAVDRFPTNFDFEVIRAELDGRAVPAATIGQYVLTGCDSGAKMSVDRTYLARAEASGRTTVRTLHQVTGIGQDRQGRYRVTVERLSDGGAVLQRLVLVCDKLIVAAGGVHTPRLLVTARDTGALPRLNEFVGTGWGTNGDQFLLLKTLLAATGAPQAGPPAFLARSRDNTATLMHAPAPLPVDAGLMLCFGMGLPNAAGRWTYSAATGRAGLSWTAANDATPRRAVMDIARQVAPRLPSGAAAVNLFAPHPLTVHPLGGAVLGKATDLHGRLHGHRGLYCLDAALMPGSTAAVNPALTIAAVVERCLDDILAKDFGVPARAPAR